VGWFRSAGWTYLLATWCFVTLSTAARGGVHSTSQVYYVVLPILATWLFGYSAALWTAGLCLGTGLIFAVLEMSGVRFAGVIPVTPMATWAILAQVIVIGTVPVAQILRTLQDTLAQSRRNQDQLQEYKEHLEGEVQRRTAELVEARDQALVANRTKSEFLANMSHELRTPLNAILGFSAMVGRDSNLSEQQRKDLAVVGTSGEHLLDLIDDVLDMAKIETGGIRVQNSSFDLRALANEIVDLLWKSALAKNLELRLDLSPELPQFIRSDSAKLRQVLTNLVGNAVKYTEEGSVVVRVDSRAIEQSQSLTLILDVEDTGIGIAPEDQSRIFDAFIQAGTPRTRQGTGLGLAISRSFVQLLGGTIQVESEVGCGSRFRVEVPVETAEASEVASTNPAPKVVGLQPGQPDYRVLIVEDQKENWLLLQRLLQMAGFQVRVVENSAEAVEVFETWRPHFIWMDLRLPGDSGLEAAKRIRSLDAGRDVKIVAVTASAFATQREDVLAAGLDDFLRKPYRPAEIFDCMARHLGVRYIYREHSTEDAAAKPIALRPEDLATLPPGLLDELENAIVSLDQGRIALVVREVTKHSDPVGSVLSLLANQFAYTPILNAHKNSRRFTGASA
jgi:signal transduction histidine kinase/CheY-like chemotaxis protein